MPSIAQQLRADRRRRVRRQRAALGVVFAGAAVLLGARFVSESGSNLAGAHPAVLATTPTFPTTTTTAPTTTSTVATGLNPGLVAAFDRAQAAAAAAHRHLTITSGFRSATEQAAMLKTEVAKRGSLAEASWWVFPPDKSMHVQGLAIDVGDGPAADWLRSEGARFGLCHTLSWEWWHFEWRARWQASGTCPAPAQTPADAPGR